MNKTPQHVAIIMDGNGRWAQSRGLPRVAGHSAGMQAVRETVKTAIEIGIPILTLYAFSQENWKRPKEEVSVLMDLLDHFVDKEIQNLEKEGVSVRTIGRIEALPAHTLDKVKEAVRMTAHNDKLILNIALNYGARTEILDAVSKILKENAVNNGASKKRPPLTEEAFASYLYTAGLPDPEPGITSDRA